MTEQEKIQLVIDDIMDNFNFNKVLKMFTAAEISHAGGDFEYTESYLRRYARYHLRKAVELGHYETGGFESKCERVCDEIFLSLKFVGEQWDTGVVKGLDGENHICPF